MQFTDTFIKRPVFASVLSLLLLLAGLVALEQLPLRQYPQLEQALIKVSTSYPGANAKLMQGFITSPLQSAIASADGIDYLTATSSTGASEIQAHLKLGYSGDQAFIDVMSKVSEAKSKLPADSEMPIVTKESDDDLYYAYISFSNDEMSGQQITDYLVRAVQPKLATILGVASADILGAKYFSLRVWLNANKMAALNITPQQVTSALQSNNYQATPGNLNGQYVVKNIHADTDIDDVEQFKLLVIQHKDNTLIRLQDVAKVELGPASYDSQVMLNGKSAIFMGIGTTPSANPLDVISAVTKALPVIERDFPPGLHVTVAYDRTTYISSALEEVQHTLIEASLIVVLVIFLFLGNLRTVTIPMVTIPLSLIGVCMFLQAMGYSINLLTLLAMVLAIGLVVDDAIVVVENIYRHIEEGKNAYDAAIQGAREIVFPVIAMTLTLAAVFVPIMFTTGLTGALFSEFAFTLAATVIISGFIALTLSPMMCSKILHHDLLEKPLVKFIDNMFARLVKGYQSALNFTLQHRAVILSLTLVVFFACFELYTHTQEELSPAEDDKFVGAAIDAPEHGNFQLLKHFAEGFDPIYESIPERENYFFFNRARNKAFVGLILKPWDQRERSNMTIKFELQKKLDNIAGLKAFALTFPSLPGTGGRDVQMVLTSMQDHKALKEVSDNFQAEAMKSGLFTYLDADVKFNMPQVELLIDRSKAAQLGITMKAISQALSVMLNEYYVSRFSIQSRSYDIIPQLPHNKRLTVEQLQQINVATLSGTMVPLSTVVSSKESVQANSLNQYQQLNAITVVGGLMPGVSTGDAVTYLQDAATNYLPSDVSYNFKGAMQRFLDEGDTLVMMFILACIVIFLVLAAQFESFSDPLIILISVPMSICGALIPLAMGGGTLNIYTKIGLLALIGLVSKAGILMVDFANKLREEENLSIREAIERSAALRLRPILMTTAAMVVGVIPLVTASGAGAESRHQLGLVIAAGMSMGTLLSLFVVPTFYTLLARKNRI